MSNLLTTFILVLASIFISAPSYAHASAEKKALIVKSIKQGYFDKVTVPGQQPQIHVKPKFILLPHEDKTMLVNVVYSYYFTTDNSENIVTIVNFFSNKKIGEYSLELGLTMN